jgi:tetratricopeptide (TPR) repeat protein
MNLATLTAVRPGGAPGWSRIGPVIGFMLGSVIGLLAQSATDTNGAAAAALVLPHDSPRKAGLAPPLDARLHSAALLPLTDLTDPTNQAPAAEDFQRQLEIARNQRKALQYQEAGMLYANLVQGSAPEAIQLTALREMGEMAHEQHNLPRAQQIYAQCVARWPQDAAVPELLLRQGLIYREMGMNVLAIAKLYAVMTTALVVKNDRFDYYQQLVLRAQNEIAETQYLLGNFAEAVESFGRLLKLDPPPANRAAIQYRYIRCLTGLGRRGEAIAQAEDFLAHCPTAPERPEVRFLCATALKQASREGEALAQVLALLQEQCGGTNGTAQSLAYWQRRAGNAIANQFYQEGDSLKALEIYQRLATLESEPEWKLPTWYQAGLVLERLGQPVKAQNYYDQILQHAPQSGAAVSPSLKTVLEMAAWRKDFLTWQVKTEQKRLELQAISSGGSASTTIANP